MLVLLLVCINCISAGYKCSVGEFSEERKNLEIGETDSINGLNLGIISTNNEPRAADLLIDARSFSLTEQINSTEIGLKKGDYNLSLVSLGGNIVNISVENDSVNLIAGDLKSVNGLQMFLESSEGAYPGTAAVNGIIGAERLELLGGILSEIIFVDNKDYLVELMSSSDTNAIIRVRKCTGDAVISEVANTDDEEEIPEELFEDTTNIEDNESSVSETTGENSLAKTLYLDLEAKDLIYYTLIAINITIIFGLVIVLLKKSKRRLEKI